MKTNVVVIGKNKLLFIDSIIPLLLELHSRYDNINFIVTMPHHEAYRTQKQNYHIFMCWKKIKVKFHILKGKNKFASYWNYFSFLLRLFSRRNIILKGNDDLPYHDKIMKIIKRISRSTEIFCLLHELASEPLRSCATTRDFYKEVKKNQNIPFKVNYDYFVSSKSRADANNFLNADIPEDKFIQCGYIRKFPNWIEYLRKNVEKHPVINGQQYFVYFVGTMGVRSNYLNEKSGKDIVEASIKILKKYNDKLLTIFKPHPNSDAEIFEGLLSKHKYENYIIDYSHPMILSEKACFVIGSHFTSCMNNSFFQGVPNIEFTSYDPIIHKRYGEKSYGGNIVDFLFLEKDWEKLDGLIERILNGDISIKRDKRFIDEEFPDTPPEFWRFWDGLILGNISV